jgi:hypothetical protein
MQTSQSSQQQSCEDARHTVPSPHAGEGQGGGGDKSPSAKLLSAQILGNQESRSGICPAWHWKQPLCWLYPPPCPSPAWGEGTLWHCSAQAQTSIRASPWRPARAAACSLGAHANRFVLGTVCAFARFSAKRKNSRLVERHASRSSKLEALWYNLL